MWKRRLSRQNCYTLPTPIGDLIEAQAIHKIFGDKVPPKNSPTSLPFMKNSLAPLVGGLDKYLDELDRNACDAVINAYTALLHSQQETDMLGTDEEGWLVLPRLPR